VPTSALGSQELLLVPDVMMTITMTTMTMTMTMTMTQNANETKIIRYETHTKPRKQSQNEATEKSATIKPHEIEK
jgi:hypothetical protein